MDTNGYGEGEHPRLPSISWNEEDLDKIFKYPCYAFQRGNIIFTTTPPPPPSSREEGGVDKRGRSSSISTSGTGGELQGQRTVGHPKLCPSSDADFCEVCRGIRSPNFARRAQTYTTHFCTRVPAKKQTVSGSSFSSSDQRSKSTGSTSTSSMVTRDVCDKNQGHISRLSTFLRTKSAREKFFSESESSSSVFSTGTDCSQWAPWRRRNSDCPQCPSSCSRASWNLSNGQSARGGGCTSTNSSLFAGTSVCSSSYPSSTGSSSFAACDVSTCCGCSSASCAASSFENLMLAGAATADSGSSVSTNGWSTRRRIRQQMEGTRNVTRLRHVFSSSSTNEDELTSSESDDDATSNGSEMGWSFGSFYEAQEQRVRSEQRTQGSCKSDSSLDVVTPFVANAGRQLDVLEKFGNIVGTLRKPGHHVGPSKNADCLCHNCRTFFSNKS